MACDYEGPLDIPAARFVLKRHNGLYLNRKGGLQRTITDECVWTLPEIGSVLNSQPGMVLSIVPVMKITEPVWQDVPNVERYRYVRLDGCMSPKAPPGLKVLVDEPRWVEQHGVVYL